MIRKINVYENRTMSFDDEHCEIVGVIGENNAEILQFAFPDTINGYKTREMLKSLRYVTDAGASTLLLENDRVYISESLTAYPEAQIWLILESVDLAPAMKWMSFAYELYFDEHPDDSKPDPGVEIRAELTLKLKAGLTALVGGEYPEGYSFEEVLGTPENNYDDGQLKSTSWKATELRAMIDAVLVTDADTIESALDLTKEHLESFKERLVPVLEDVYDIEYIADLPFVDNSNDNLITLIEGLGNEYISRCAKEIADILNDMMHTTIYTGETWDEIKQAIISLYDDIVAMTEEAIDNGTY